MKVRGANPVRKNTDQVTTQQFGQAGDKPVPADCGDGRADFGVFRPSNGTWYTSLDPATNYGAIQFGSANDKPMPGDYDGDASADLAVFRPSTNTWYIVRSTTHQFQAVQFGSSGDIPVTAANRIP